MGTREEGAGVKIVLGFSGKIRPMQAEAGPCNRCGEVVFVDTHANAREPQVHTVEFRHWACSLETEAEPV
jgi:hypothetical protein